MRASEALGLPHFISAETAEICHSKGRMRAMLGSDFEGNVPYMTCASADEAASFRAFPGMMKPTDSQGQRGCFRVNSEEEIRREFYTSMDFSHEGKVIIEAFLEGPEISVNGFVVDGEMRFAMVSDRISFDEYPGGIIKEHLIPSALDSSIQDKAKRVAAEAARRIGINNGPCYFQIKLDGNMDPKILEITPRLDGCHMWNLIKRYCGVDLLDASFRLLMGEEVDLTPKACEDKCRLTFFCQPPWTKFRKDDCDCSDAEYSFFYYGDGEKVRRLNGYIEKCGYKITRERSEVIK
jgi:biotin carboxylase